MQRSKSKTSEDKMLTDVELELMTILWKINEGSVADVMEHLANDRKLAYTSTSTMLRILEQKGILKTRKEGRGHVYIPALKKSEYESKALKHVVEKVFDGTPMALVKQLLSSKEINAQDLAELRALIEKAEGKK